MLVSKGQPTMQPINPAPNPTHHLSPKAKNTLLILLAVLAVLAIGSAVWQTSQLSDQTAKVDSLQSANKDLQASATTLQAQLDNLKAGTGTTTTQPTDQDKILAASDAYVRAPVAATSTKFEYTVTKNTGKFALVNVKVPEGGGYQLWLKKVGDNWTVLFGGQDQPAQEDIDKYGIPTDL
jgi:hypothetical protein